MTILKIEPNVINTQAEFAFGNLTVVGNIGVGSAVISTSETGDIAFNTATGTVEFNSNTVSFLANVAVEGPQGAVGYTGSQGVQGPIGYTGSAGITGYTGSGGTGYTGSAGSTSSIKRYITLSQPGTIATPFTGVARLYPPTNIIISNVYANLGTVSSTNFQFTILKNGVSAATYTINSNTNKMSVTSANISLTMDDYITINVTAGTGATDLKVDLEYTN